MTLMLGLDTGGTYTDAALIDEERLDARGGAIVAKAKSLTTRDDLSRGIGAAVDAVLGDIDPAQVSLVALSTTLATNALVEGQGAPAALIFVGFTAADLARGDLGNVLGDTPVITATGGHRSGGDQAAPLDLDAIRTGLHAIADQISAVAICALFAVRNPAHEVAMRDMVRAEFNLPTTCSHELSAKINGPKRAVTALLNARLIAMIDRLVASAEGLLAGRGITAPLMVVRGDGALVSASFARMKPIETILSGPAASLVGAAFLTGLQAGIVADIGGTTTDVAVLSDGRPRIDPDGAAVGGVRTMVEAVAMRTHGLGGDSEVTLAQSGLIPEIHLGPRRAIPISLLLREHPDLRDVLLAQLRNPRPLATDGRFVVGLRPDLLPNGELRDLAQRCIPPRPLAEFTLQRGGERLVARAVAQGAVQIAGFTPSDAAHVLGLHSAWDVGAAQLAADLFARQRGGNGLAVFADGATASRAVLDRLIRRSAELVLETAFAEDGMDGIDPARDAVVRAALGGHSGLLHPKLDLTVPLIGLGASAATHYPHVAALLDVRDATPADADVANAVGAVVGQVHTAFEVTVNVPQEGRFDVLAPDGVRTFTDEGAALSHASDIAGQHALAQARLAGTDDAALTLRTRRRSARIEGREQLIEAVIRASASGRPRRAR